MRCVINRNRFCECLIILRFNFIRDSTARFCTFIIRKTLKGELSMRRKITVVGAGHVGEMCAERLLQKGLGDVVLLDVLEGIPQGKALDQRETAPVEGYDCSITGTNNYADTEGSDLVIVTAGLARRPGMSRDDLLMKNYEIVKDVSKRAASFSPNAFMIVVSNPLDAMVQTAYKFSGFARERVLGMAGILDSARFRSFIAQELDVCVTNIQTLVLGGHGDTMVPLIRYTTVAGIPLAELMSRERIEALIERTRKGGAEIVSLLKSGSAYYAPSAAAVEMAECILLDRKKILPCAALLQGEYGIDGIFMGVPIKLGANGVEEIIELNLTSEEQAMLEHSAEHVRNLVRKLNL